MDQFQLLHHDVTVGLQFTVRSVKP